MRLRDETTKTGHLLAFISKNERIDNFSLFFPVDGLEQFDSLLKVTNGFESCLEPIKDKYTLNGYSIANIDRVEDAFTEVDRTRMLRFEITEFLTNDFQFTENVATIILHKLSQREHPIFPDIVTGAMATSLNFYNRDEEVKKIWNGLQEGKNLLLQAPRRYGKSSLLYRISVTAPPGWSVCYVDLEGDKSAEDFVEEILRGMVRNEDCNACLPTDLADRQIWKELEVKKLDTIREHRIKIKHNWKKYANDLFESMDSAKKHLLLILDEVSFFIEDMITSENEFRDKINDFMEWFNELRQKTTNICFILSGSEHLPSFFDLFGIDGHLEDLETFHLGLFEGQTAREFIQLVLAGKKVVVRSDEIDLILDLMGEPIPYFLQLFLDTLSRKCRETQHLEADEIKTVYYRELLGPGSKRYFEPIQRQLDRYSRYGGGNRTGAERLLDFLTANDSVDLGDLKAIWQDTPGWKVEFEIMLRILRDDFYVEEENGTVFLSSKLLKDWWERNS